MARSGRFGTFLVGVGSTSTLKPSFASRFCELISIDVEKFRSLMIDQAQEAENLPINISWQEACPETETVGEVNNQPNVFEGPSA